MSKRNKERGIGRRDGGIPSGPTYPGKDQLVPSDNNLRRVADSIRNDLIRNGDRRLQVIAPIGIAVGALGYYSGPSGTQELYDVPIGTREFEDYTAREILEYYQRNPNELKTRMLGSGVLSKDEAGELDFQARRGNILWVNTFIITKIGQAHEDILQRPNPRESILIQNYSRLPQSTAQGVERNSGQLVAMCNESALRRGTDILSPTRLMPKDLGADNVTYGLLDSLEEPSKRLTIPVDSPQTLFVGGPGIATAGTLSSFLKFPRSIYADKSEFVASLIRSTATIRDKRVGNTLEGSDVVARSSGIERAAAEFAADIDIAQFSMVQSAPREAVQLALNALFERMRRGRVVFSLMPDRVYPSETSFQTFSQIAQDAGFVRTPFLIDGRQMLEYDFSLPNVTPGREIPDRRVFAGVFRKP